MSILTKIYKAINSPSCARDYLYLATNRKGLKLESPTGYSFEIPRHVSNSATYRLYTGLHECEEIDILRAYFNTCANIIEIGANFGVVSRIALEEKLQENGAMVCIEPNPQAFEYLKLNTPVSSNKTVQHEQCAIGIPQNGHASASFISRNGLTSGLIEHMNTKKGDHIINVPIKRLSDYAMQINGSYGLICDAEGAEIDIVFKDPKALKNCDQIMIELHEPKLTGRPETPEDVLSQLNALGFKTRAELHHSYYLSR